MAAKMASSVRTTQTTQELLEAVAAEWASAWPDSLTDGEPPAVRIYACEPLLPGYSKRVVREVLLRLADDAEAAAKDLRRAVGVVLGG